MDGGFAPKGLFDEVVERCGLARMLGPGLVRRALADVGRTDSNATAQDFREALPRLEQRLQTYYGGEALAARMRALDELIEQAILDEGWG